MFHLEGLDAGVSAILVNHVAEGGASETRLFANGVGTPDPSQVRFALKQRRHVGFVSSQRTRRLLRNSSGCHHQSVGPAYELA